MLRQFHDIFKGTWSFYYWTLTLWVKILPTSKRTVIAPAQNENQRPNALLHCLAGLTDARKWGVEIGPWNGMAKGQDEATAFIFRGPLRYAGESLDSKEDVMYVRGKAGLTEATSGQTLSTAPPTAPLGCDGKNKVHGALRYVYTWEGNWVSTFFFLIGMF